MASIGSDIPVIHFDYEFSPVGQKTKLLLEAAGVPYQRVDLPVLLPRKDLETMGIYYRRVPVLAVGKDVYCDSSSIFEVILNKLAQKKVATSVSDVAWETWGVTSFSDCLTLIPDALMSDDFINDRKTVFPILARSDYKTLKPSGLADLQSRMHHLEHVVLRDAPHIGGSELSVADIHALWGVRWALQTGEGGPPGLGVSKEQGVGRDRFPKLWRLIDSLPELKAETIPFDAAWEKIRNSQYTASAGGVAPDDPTGIKAGTPVTVDSLDADPHKHPTPGTLVATSPTEIVIEVPTGLRLHFPREGQILRARA